MGHGDRSGSWRGSRRSEIEVGHGVGHVDRRSEWVMAWVMEIRDQSGLKWVFGYDRCFWLWFLVVFGVGLVFLVVIFGCGCGFCA